MSQQNSNADLVKDILIHLGYPPKAPTLQYLNRLIHAYIRKIPWESVSRIIQRHTTQHPVSENKYEVECSHRPSKNLFTLIDVPVSLSDFQAIVEDDYDEASGRFLKSVVMVKVVDHRAQRFFSDQKPYKLESFDRKGGIEKLIEPEILPQLLAELFQMPEDSISAALSWVQNPPVTVSVPALSQDRIGQHA